MRKEDTLRRSAALLLLRCGGGHGTSFCHILPLRPAGGYAVLRHGLVAYLAIITVRWQYYQYIQMDQGVIRQTLHDTTPTRQLLVIVKSTPACSLKCTGRDTPFLGTTRNGTAEHGIVTILLLTRLRRTLVFFLIIHRQLGE